MTEIYDQIKKQVVKGLNVRVEDLKKSINLIPQFPRFKSVIRSNSLYTLGTITHLIWVI